MRNKYFVLFLLFFMLLSFARADNFYIGNPSNSIVDNYAKDSYLGGWLNISFNNLTSDAQFSDSLNNKVYLTDILNSPQNSGYVFSCDTSSCTSVYNVLNPESTKNFHLAANGTKLFGIGFEDNVADISSISFSIYSNAVQSCSNQIAVDIFDDKTTDYINNQGSGVMCADVYKGCSQISGSPSDNNGGNGNGGGNVISNDSGSGSPPGNSGVDTGVVKLFLSLFKIRKTGKVITGYDIQTSDIVITATPICQRIEFLVAPSYEVGAWIKEENSGTMQFNMDVYNLNGTKINSCVLSKANLPLGGSAYLGCKTNFYLVQPQEFYVCLSGNSGTGKYVTRGYTPTGEKCGFQGIPPQTEIGAYDIYVRKQQFGSLTNGMTVSNNLSSGVTLAELVKNYILQNYGTLNCTDGCAVPFRIYSGTDQDITIKNISIIYQGTLGQTESKNIYDIQENLSRLTSKYQKLYVDGFFSLPSTSQSIDYILKLNNQQILEKNIRINDLSININPTTASAGIASTFSVQTSPSQTITDYIWSFGDRSAPVETTNNSISHTYSEMNDYPISVGIKTSSGTYFKFSKITVGSPSSNLGDIFFQKAENLKNLENQLKTLDNFSASKIREYTDLDNSETTFNQLWSEYNSTTNETLISDIANELSSINIPDNMIINSQQEKTISINKENINTDAFSSAIGSALDSNDTTAYTNAIANWAGSKAEIKMSANRFDFSVNGNTEEGFSVYKFSVDNSDGGSTYLLIKDMKDFASPENFSQADGYDYIKLEGNSNDVEIVSSNNLNTEDVQFFIAPEISKLDLTNAGGNGSTNTSSFDLKKLIIYVAIGIGVLILIIVVYFIYSKLSKRKTGAKVELFKDKTELDNIKNYINNARRNGIGDSDIMNNLRKSGWNNAQINYAMKI